MRYLLDTGLFLRLHLDPERLSVDSRDLITDPDNRVWLSVVSIWEIVIKSARGRLRLNYDLAQLMAESRFEVLPVHPEHVLGVRKLVGSDAGPFDCMLVAQATAERLTLLTTDDNLLQYGDFVHVV